jgi:predicted nucleic acid-binding protein
MRLEDLPAGERIFVDANILIYHFSGLSPECRAFLQRCESRQVEAFTGVHIVLEVMHRLMLLEAVHRGLISGGQLARKLKERPEIVKGLREYNRSIRQIPRMGLRVRAIPLAVVRASEAVRVQEGLLTNDSITVALMGQVGVTAIATHDADLDKVANLSIYQPGDIPRAAPPSQ